MDFAFIQAASHVTHVVVDSVPPSAVEPFYKQDRFWFGAGAIASALVAVFTYFLGKQTKNVATETQKLATATKGVAEETQRLAAATNTVATETQRLATATSHSVELAQQSIEAEERRHRESLEPHVAIVCEHFLTPPPVEQKIGVFLKNTGPGVAVKVRVDSSNMSTTGLLVETLPTVLEARVGIARIISKHPGASVDIAPITVTYEDQLGNRFESRSEGPSIVPGTAYSFRRTGSA
jgi:hypothetical protein